MEAFSRRLLFLSLPPLSSPRPLLLLFLVSALPAQPLPRARGARRGRCSTRRAPVPACARRPAGGGRRQLRARPRPRPRGPRCGGGAGGRVQLGPRQGSKAAAAAYRPPAPRPSLPAFGPASRAPAPPPIPERGAAPRRLLPRPQLLPARPQRRRHRGSKGRAGRERAGRGASRKPAGQVQGKATRHRETLGQPGKMAPGGPAVD